MFAASVLLSSVALASTVSTPLPKGESLEQILSSRLPALGHRNWVVVADSAYPLQVSPGVETITVRDDQISAVRKVLAALKRTKHVRPIIYLDKEMAFVPEKSAPGIGKYRRDLGALLNGQPTARKLHEEIIGKLDEAGKTFHVLLIKTPQTLAYTSVFFQLECGYWSASSEQSMRAEMKKKGQ
jgi:hypothetical protein